MYSLMVRWIDECYSVLHETMSDLRSFMEYYGIRWFLWTDVRFEGYYGVKYNMMAYVSHVWFDGYE